VRVGAGGGWEGGGLRRGGAMLSGSQHPSVTVCLVLQLLVREPYGVVQSFSKGLQPTLQELGYGVSKPSDSSRSSSSRSRRRGSSSSNNSSSSSIHTARGCTDAAGAELWGK
jgi:hypothetical protein